MRILVSLYLVLVMVGCSVVMDAENYQAKINDFPWEESCQNAARLLSFDTSMPGHYCFARDIVDGAEGKKRESIFSKALSGGHRVSGIGAFYVNVSHVVLDMRGFGVYSNHHSQGGVWAGRSDFGINDVVVRNGVSSGLIDAFGIGEMFYDIEDGGYLYGGGSYHRNMVNKHIKFANMVFVGGSGNVMADEASIEESKIELNRIYVSGRGFLFRGNKYIVKGLGVDYAAVDGVPGAVVYKTNVPFYKQHNQADVSMYDHAVGVYLACADNAVIDGNIFSSKTGNPGVPAIVVKRSQNVRITNNIFEGFANPVLMDKYSSVIDASGNLIRSNVTADSPESLLYALKMEPEPIIKKATGEN